MDWVYHHVFVLRFMRTTNKAAPLVAVGVAGLLGLGARQALEWLRTLRRPRLRTRGADCGAGRARRAAGAGGAAARPRQGDRHPAAVQADRPPPGSPPDTTWTASCLSNSRAMVLPGQIFAFYKWGGTLDAILPAADFETGRGALRDAVLGPARRRPADHGRQPRPAAPARSRRAEAAAGADGVGSVVTGTDDDLSRSGAIDPAAAAPVLSQQLGSADAQLRPGVEAAGGGRRRRVRACRCPRCAATVSLPGAESST